MCTIHSVSLNHVYCLTAPPHIHVAADIEEVDTEAEKQPSDSMPRQSSENAMLLDDTLKHLSNENAPPDQVPGSQTSLGSSRSGGVADARKKFEQKFGVSSRGARPPPKQQPSPASDDHSPNKHAFVKLKPVSGKVGSIASAFSKPNETAESAEPKRPPFANLKPVAGGGRGFPSGATKKPPTEQKSPSESTEAKNALAKLKPTSPSSPPTTSGTKPAASVDKPSSPPQPAAAAEAEDSDEAKNKFVQLKKVQKGTSSMKNDDTELAKIKLKKATKNTPPVSHCDSMF